MRRLSGGAGQNANGIMWILIPRFARERRGRRRAMSANGRSRTAPGGERELVPEAITRIVLRPVATSLPLGFLAFGAGNILLTALELRGCRQLRARR